MMERKNNFLCVFCLVAFGLGFVQPAWAANMAKNTVQLQALDKISGQKSVIEVPVNGEVKFGSFSIVIRKCLTASQDETPENYAFVDVADADREGKLHNIFKGWMVSSSPSLNSVEHPVYDVWLIQCHDKKTDAVLLSESQLAERDKLEKYKAENLSKEAKIAIKVQKKQEKQERQAKAEQEIQDKIKAEEKEAETRQKALEKEIQAQQELQQIEEITNDGKGPVSLFNLGQRTTEEASSESSEKLVDAPVVIEEDTTPADDGVDGLVIIEDTHHDTIGQDLDLPEDISEVIPEATKE